jgi:HNH endonuclease
VGKILMHTQKDINRFWSKVDKSNNCWEWKKLLDKKGYGLITVKNKTIYAHRFSALIAGLDITDKFVCHKCDNPKCVKPDHLFLGTLQDNKNDEVSKNRQARGSKHGMTNLTENDVIHIKNNYIRGNRTKVKSNSMELAKMFNVTDQTIRNIAKNKTWSHI